ncbi:ATP-dependent helicase C-terminal domain-containing protein, partial [Lysobacter sp. D1-1-M9]|uniref:ATP-dependent helicase C-terminal domain-containing protein n=1 Tax=Novilysobacter longmucuonensis TaxID=3098603 RepID=UPI002FC8D4D1
DALPWSPPLRQWRARVQCLREWCPELELPDMSGSALLAGVDEWLKPVLSGKSRLDAISEAELAEALKSRLPWATRQRIDVLAPVRTAVPSGLERPVEYGFDEAADSPVAPVLAVKLQELFGLADTPRIVEGRI